jgi:hypothetical protein
MVLLATALDEEDASPDNKTWKQLEQAAEREKVEAAQQEKVAMESSSAGRSKPSKRTAEVMEEDADAEQAEQTTGTAPSKKGSSSSGKFKAGGERRKAAKTAPRTDAIDAATAKVGAYLDNQQQVQASKELRQMATAVIRALVSADSYKEDGMMSGARVADWGLTEESLDVLVEPDMEEDLRAIQSKLKLGPSRVLQKYLQALNPGAGTGTGSASEA